MWASGVDEVDILIALLVVVSGLLMPAVAFSAEVLAYPKFSPLPSYLDPDFIEKGSPLKVDFGVGLKILEKAESSIKVEFVGGRGAWVKNADVTMSASLGSIDRGAGYELNDRPRLQVWSDPRRLGDFLGAGDIVKFAPDWFEVVSLGVDKDIHLPLIAVDHQLLANGRSVERAQVLFPFSPKVARGLSVTRHLVDQEFDISFIVDRSHDAIDFSEELLFDVADDLARLFSGENNKFNISISYFESGALIQTSAGSGLEGMRRKMPRSVPVARSQKEPLLRAFEAELRAVDPAASKTIIVVLSGANLDAIDLTSSVEGEDFSNILSKDQSSTVSAIFALSTPEPADDLADFSRNMNHIIESTFLDFTDDLARQISDGIADKIQPLDIKSISDVKFQAICELRSPVSGPCFLPATSESFGTSFLDESVSLDWVARPGWLVVDGLIIKSTLDFEHIADENSLSGDHEGALASDTLLQLKETKDRLLRVQEQADVLVAKSDLADLKLQETIADSINLKDQLALVSSDAEALKAEKNDLQKRSDGFQKQLNAAHAEAILQVDLLARTKIEQEHDRSEAASNLTHVLENAKIETARYIADFNTLKADRDASIADWGLRFGDVSSQLAETEKAKSDLLARISDIFATKTGLEALNLKISADLTENQTALGIAASDLEAARFALKASEIKSEAVLQQNADLTEKLTLIDEYAKELEDQRAALAIQISTLRSELQQANGRYSTLQATSNGFALAEKQAVVALKTERLKSVADHLEALARIDALQLELKVNQDLLRDRIAQKDADLVGLLAASELEKAQLSSLVAELQSAKSALVVELGALSVDRKQGKSDLAEAEAALQVLREAALSHDISDADFTAKLKSASAKMDGLRAELLASNQAVEKLKTAAAIVLPKAKPLAVSAPRPKAAAVAAPTPAIPTTTGFFGNGG